MPHHPSPHVDDAWFDVVPMALLEFNEHGRVLRQPERIARGRTIGLQRHHLRQRGIFGLVFAKFR